MEVVKLSVSNFEEEVLKADKTVLVDFYADWCGPCKMLSPVIDGIAKEVDGKVKVCKLNVDECSEIAGEYGVMSIPTLIIFKNGEVVNTLVGLRSRVEILESLEV